MIVSPQPRPPRPPEAFSPSPHRPPPCMEEWGSLAAGDAEGDTGKPLGPVLKACFDAEKLGVC